MTVLALYSCRALRTQQFLASTAADLADREAKQRAVWQELEASRRGKLVSRTQLDEFYSRLQVGGVGGECHQQGPSGVGGMVGGAGVVA
jgi:hypothetical protein